MGSKSLENLYELARRAKYSSDWECAAHYYQEILYENPKDWEATFYVGLNNATVCTLAQFKTATSRMEDAFTTAVKLMDKDDEISAEIAIKEMTTATLLTLRNFHNTALKHYSEFASLPNSRQELNSRRMDLTGCAAACGSSIDSLYHEDLRKLCVKFYLFAIEMQCEIIDMFPASSVNSLRILVDGYVRTIQKYHPEYKNPVDEALKKMATSKTTTTNNNGGCYVATAVYGSYDCPQVWTLRRFRDFKLAESWHGRLFVKVYYAVSPTVVKLFGKTKWFNTFWKKVLDSAVNKLNAKGYSNSKYNDREW